MKEQQPGEYAPPHEPTPIDLVRQLRVVLGLPSGALAMTPKAAWDEAIERVRNLASGRCSTCLEREGRHPMTGAYIGRDTHPQEEA